MTAFKPHFRFLYTSMCTVWTKRSMIFHETYLCFQHICRDGGKTKAAQTTGQGEELGQHSSLCRLPLKKTSEKFTFYTSPAVLTAEDEEN